jgi:hypothetical protein
MSERPDQDDTALGSAAEQLEASREHTAQAHEAAAVVSESVGDNERAADHRAAAAGRSHDSPVGDPPDEGGAGEVGAETAGGEAEKTFDGSDETSADGGSS